MRNGYKNALRDRMPHTIDLALRWCKAKDRYIKFIYENYIKKVNPKRKLDTIKVIYGLKPAVTIHDVYINLIMSNKRVPIEKIKKAPRELFRLEFEDTILTNFEIRRNKDLYNYWLVVSGWVKWFKSKLAYIEADYKMDKLLGRSEKEIRIDLEKYIKDVSPIIHDKLLNYLIKNLKQNE